MSSKSHVDDNGKVICAKIGKGGLNAEPKQRVRSKSFVNQHTGTYQERCLFSVTGAHLHPPLSDVHRTSFTFTGKERDEETGYGYFSFSPLDFTSFVIPLGTISKVHRTFFTCYMDADLLTSWLSVDPMADKYPNLSPYNYCVWNPIHLVDPDGRDWYVPKGATEPVWKKIVNEQNLPDGSTYIGKTAGWCGQHDYDMGYQFYGDENGNLTCTDLSSWEKATLRYNGNNMGKLSHYSHMVIFEDMMASGVESATITSTYRTPESQVSAMLNNLKKSNFSSMQHPVKL